MRLISVLGPPIALLRFFPMTGVPRPSLVTPLDIIWFTPPLLLIVPALPIPPTRSALSITPLVSGLVLALGDGAMAVTPQSMCFLHPLTPSRIASL